MAAGRIVLPCMPALDRNGNPVSGALLYFYLNETTTLQTVYSDFALSTPLTNPVVANSAGVFPDIFADDAVLYTVRGFQPDGTTLPDSSFDFVQSGSFGGSGGGNAIGVNLLVNPDGSRWTLRRGSPTDTQHSFDMWRVLISNASAISATQSISTSSSPAIAMRIQNSQGGAIRMGQSQAIEAEVVQALWGGPAAFGGQVRSSVTTMIRYAVLAWSGTANAPPSDVVNDWNSASYTTGGFFVNTAGLSILGTRTIAVSANVWTDLPGLVISNVGTPSNLIVMYWTESAVASGVTLDFRGKVESGSASTAFSKLSPAEFRDQCDRYIQSTYQEGVSPSTNNAVEGRVSFLVTNIPSNGRLPVQFRTRMHATPTVTLYSTSTPALAGNANDAGGNNYSATPLSVGQSGFEMSNSSPGAQNAVAFHYVADRQF